MPVFKANDIEKLRCLHGGRAWFLEMDLPTASRDFTTAQVVARSTGHVAIFKLQRQAVMLKSCN